MIRLVALASVCVALAGCDSGSESAPASAPSSRAASLGPSSGPAMVSVASAPAALDPEDAAVIKVVAEHTHRRPSEITPGTTFSSLSLDHLDFVEIVMDLEDEFGVSIPDERIPGARRPKPGALIMAPLNFTVHDLALVVRDCREHPAGKSPASTKKSRSDAGKSASSRFLS